MAPSGGSEDQTSGRSEEHGISSRSGLGDKENWHVLLADVDVGSGLGLLEKREARESVLYAEIGDRRGEW